MNNFIYVLATTRLVHKLLQLGKRATAHRLYETLNAISATSPHVVWCSLALNERMTQKSASQECVSLQVLVTAEGECLSISHLDKPLPRTALLPFLAIAHESPDVDKLHNTNKTCEKKESMASRASRMPNTQTREFPTPRR